MANLSSSKKATRQIERRTAVNKNRRTRMRTYLRRVEEAIAGGDQAVAAEALRVAQPEVMRVVKHGILHKNTASRKISRLAKRVKARILLALVLKFSAMSPSVSPLLTTYIFFLWPGRFLTIVLRRCFTFL